MISQMIRGLIVANAWLVSLTFLSSVEAQDSRLEFFESRIRPVLIEHCYECHNSLGVAEGGLALDWKTATRQTTDQGPAVVPFDPERSRLLGAIQHKLPGYEMPEGGDPLSPEIIADFQKWIADGAFDPRLKAPSKTELSQVLPWNQELEKRKQRWCYQPLKNPSVPDAAPHLEHPIDQFIRQRLADKNLTAASPAEPGILLRRLAFRLQGLPPKWEDLEQFAEAADQASYLRLVDTYLASPEFGEHWARHWMDLVRYADSHGSEGDPTIPHAYRYRDYLIRAFNADVPYDQLIREHLAGDLLTAPRQNDELKINESAIGTAHLRLVFHGFAPTDALDEKVRFTDDQINVISKAFLGLTVSCARCHNHKFDAISQEDYYALFGVLGACRPAMQDVNLVSQQNLNKTALVDLKNDLRSLLATQWQTETDSLAERIQSGPRLSKIRETAPEAEEKSVLEPFLKTQALIRSGKSFDEAWQQLNEEWQNELNQLREDELRNNVWSWNLQQPKDFHEWHQMGNGLNDQPHKAGQFTVAAENADESIIEEILPAGVFTHSLSKRHRGVLGSPRFHLDGAYRVWIRMLGGNGATARYVVQNYPRDGTVYPIHTINNHQWHWHSFDLGYWQGDHAHLEFATAADAPLKVNSQDRSWFGVRDVIVRHRDAPGPRSSRLETWMPLWEACQEKPPNSLPELAALYQTTLKDVIKNWQSQTIDDRESLFLNASLQMGLLENVIGHNAAVDELTRRVRDLEASIPLPTRVPGVMEADVFDQPLYARGDHKRPLSPVRRRFLEAVDATPFGQDQSGRLELADAIISPSNPLTARVAVNRVWHYLFGKGLVPTPDNFGELGSDPSHPELLDFLAYKFQREGWSIKELIRFIVTSDTWQQSSNPSALASKVDPENQFLSHANLKRLDAESIRDSLFAATDSLILEKYGSGFTANTLAPRRAIYVQSRRNGMDQFLQVFDSPLPFATTGRRISTNVPAQSLSMLNDPLVWHAAQQLGELIRANPNLATDPLRVEALFNRCLGRDPTERETTRFLQYLQQLKETQLLRQQTQQKLSRTESSIHAIIDPARERLLNQNPSDASPAHPQALAHWDFQAGLEDLIGNLDSHIVGEVSLGPEGLKLNGNGYVATSPLSSTLKAKTLEAWVRLENVDQRGGGVMTVQDLKGGVFDSIVFGERQPGHWLAGSNSFARTEDFGGPAETKGGGFTHIAITYRADGTITAYRNGTPYGVPIQKSPLIFYADNKSEIVFGIRHGKSVSSSRMLRGTLAEAKLYSRALEENEIQAASRGQAFISLSEIVASLDAEQQKAYAELESERQRLEHEIVMQGGPTNEAQIWAWLAHSLFNLKEFIYLR